MKSVVMLGSYMHCYFANGTEIPRCGETLTGQKYFVASGGKGISQALTCARLGSDTRFIGRLGDDAEADMAIGMLKGSGLVGPELIKRDALSHTGIAIILTDSHGNNAIMVVPGANARIAKEDIDGAEGILENADIMGFVLENNMDMVEYGIKKAYGMGIKTFLDPAPAAPLKDDIYKNLSYIKPNEHEAGMLTGIEVRDSESAVRAGEWFLDKGVGTAVITMGDQGSVLVSRETKKYFAAPKVEVVDSTSAGDVFAGAMIAKLNQQYDIEDALVYASCAAALAVTKSDMILDVIPYDEDVQKLVKAYKAENPNGQTVREAPCVL